MCTLGVVYLVRVLQMSQVQKEGALDNFDISDKSRNNLEKHGYKYLFPIQASALNVTT